MFTWSPKLFSFRDFPENFLKFLFLTPPSVHEASRLNQFRLNKTQQIPLNHLKAQSLAYPQLETSNAIYKAFERIENFYFLASMCFQSHRTITQAVLSLQTTWNPFSRDNLFWNFIFHLRSFWQAFKDLKWLFTTRQVFHDTECCTTRHHAALMALEIAHNSRKR